MFVTISGRPGECGEMGKFAIAFAAIVFLGRAAAAPDLECED
jgi:hypothetical protein